MFFQPPAHPNLHSTTPPIKCNEQLLDLIPNPIPHFALDLTDLDLTVSLSLANLGLTIALIDLANPTLGLKIETLASRR
jgi:hypothetical protein